MGAHPRRRGDGNLAAVETEIDWVIKRRLIERYQVKHGLALSDPRLQQVDLAYHDITRRRGCSTSCSGTGRSPGDRRPGRPSRRSRSRRRRPRAKLRGDFVQAASANRRDFTVDWCT